MAGENVFFYSIVSDSQVEAKSVLSKNHSAVMQNCSLLVSDQVKVAQIGSPSCNASEITFYDPYEQKIQDQIQINSESNSSDQQAKN